MKLVPAPGSPQMQRALSHRYVHTIVDILLQYPELLTGVARLLQTYEQHAQSGIEDALEALRIIQRRPNATGQTIASHVIELTQTIHDLYQQSNEVISYQRGAIVELLAYKLVSARYAPAECLGNHSFHDTQGRPITGQVDVAALSRDRNQLEGYECKLKANSIESSDCTNLVYLAQTAQNLGYRANVGFVTFDDDMYMRRKVARFNPPSTIKFYGLDSIKTLRDNPF